MKYRLSCHRNVAYVNIAYFVQNIHSWRENPQSNLLNTYFVAFWFRSAFVYVIVSGQYSCIRRRHLVLLLYSAISLLHSHLFFEVIRIDSAVRVRYGCKSIFQSMIYSLGRCNLASVTLHDAVSCYKETRLNLYQRLAACPPLPWASGNPVAIQCAWNLDPSVHWNVTGIRIVGSQYVSSVLPVVFQWPSSVFQFYKLTLDHHRDTTGCEHQPVEFQWHSSVLVAPVVFQCVPIMQINTGSPLEHHWVLAWASVVLVASQCTSRCSGLPVWSSGIPVYWQNLVWGSLGQVTSQHATAYVCNRYGESCLS